MEGNWGGPLKAVDNSKIICLGDVVKELNWRTSRHARIDTQNLWSSLWLFPNSLWWLTFKCIEEKVRFLFSLRILSLSISHT